MKEIKIKSYVGGHTINVYSDCEFNPEIRKYMGGALLCQIPYSGKMLSVEYEIISEEEITIDGKPIKVLLRKPKSIDLIPSKEECDYCIVSAEYACVCKSMGCDTSRLLTMATPVVDKEGRVIGTTGFNKV